MKEGEPLKIPSDWKFPERNEKGLKIKQLDLGERFLAISLPNAPDIEYPLDSGDPPFRYIKWPIHYKGEYADYFFNEKGMVIDCRRCSKLATDIIVRKSDAEMFFTMHEGWDSPSDSGMFFLILKPTPEVQFFDSLSIVKEAGFGRRIAQFGFEHISKDIHNKNLETVMLGENFASKKSDSEIKFPVVTVFNRYSIGNTHNQRAGLTISDWAFHFDDRNNKSFLPDKQEKPNEVLFRSKKGEPVFRLNWEVEDGKLIVSQTHLPTQITRVLRAPVILPMDEVEKAVFSRPPYEKVKDRLSGSEDLVVPWRNIDQILGVSLSYSRPVPQKKT